MPSADKQLLAEIESLYRSRFADFVAAAAALIGEREAAREAVQDAFAVLVRGRRKFRRDAPLEAWAWGAVINAARKKRWAHAREAWARPSTPSSNGSGHPAEADSELAALVAALPEHQQDQSRRARVGAVAVLCPPRARGVAVTRGVSIP